MGFSYAVLGKVNVYRTKGDGLQDGMTQVLDTQRLFVFIVLLLVGSFVMVYRKKSQR